MAKSLVPGLLHGTRLPYTCRITRVVVVIVGKFLCLRGGWLMTCYTAHFVTAAAARHPWVAPLLTLAFATCCELPLDCAAPLDMVNSTC